MRGSPRPSIRLVLLAALLAAVAGSLALADAPGDRNDGVYAVTAFTLYEYDASSQMPRKICDLRLPGGAIGFVSDITEDMEGNLYAIGQLDSILYRFSPDDCLLRRVTIFGKPEFSYKGLATDREGNVYVGGDGIIRYEPRTGRVIQFIKGGEGRQTAGDLLVDDQVMYWAVVDDEAPSALDRIDLRTGLITRVASIPTQGAVWGLAKDPYSGDLLLFTDKGEVMRLDPAHPERASISRPIRESWFGAASKPYYPKRPVIGD